MLCAPFLLLATLAFAVIRVRYGSLAEARRAAENLFAGNPYFQDSRAKGAMAWGIAAVMVIVAAFTFGVGSWVEASQPAPPPTVPVYGNVPNFSLTDQNGRMVTLSALSGKIWVADFILTRCTDKCPMLTSHMVRLRKKLLADPRVRFVSVSVDPRYDKPHILSAYAEKHGARDSDWYFLTGDDKKVVSLIERGFHLPLVADPHETLTSRKEPDIGHSMKFVLVDGAGKLRGYYDGEQMGSVNTIPRDVSSLEKESP